MPFLQISDQFLDRIRPVANRDIQRGARRDYRTFGFEFLLLYSREFDVRHQRI